MTFKLFHGVKDSHFCPLPSLPAVGHSTYFFYRFMNLPSLYQGWTTSHLSNHWKEWQPLKRHLGYFLSDRCIKAAVKCIITGTITSFCSSLLTQVFDFSPASLCPHSAGIVVHTGLRRPVFIIFLFLTVFCYTGVGGFKVKNTNRALMTKR